MNALSPSPLPFASRMASLRPSAIREILKTTESPDVISFAGGLPAAEFFPCEEIRAAADAVLQSDGPGALQYGITEGYGPLREWAAGHLRETVGLEVPPSQILITHGSQQGLDLLGKVLIDPGDTVIVESPAYLGALQAFQAYQANVVGIPADEEGLRADLLADTLARGGPRPKFLYLIPNFQNPTGTSMSVRRRREIARLAREHDLLVVEDDPYGRLRYSGEESPALGTLPDAGDWAYLGTASKILAPGLRVAWLATSHRGLYEKLVTGKQSCDLHTSTLNQRIVWQAVSQTAWLDSHIRRIRQAYGARRDAMLRALERHLPKGARWTHPDGGLFLWVTLPGAVDTIELLRQAGSCKVAFVPGAPFWVGNVPKNTLRLNFSHAAEPLIEEGIARLGQLVARS